MILSHNTPTKIKRGHYFVQYQITSGSVSLAVSINGLSPISLPELSSTSDGFEYVSLPECTLTPTITGDATAAIALVAGDHR